jgi:hypothetical protein
VSVGVCACVPVCLCVCVSVCLCGGAPVPAAGVGSAALPTRMCTPDVHAQLHAAQPHATELHATRFDLVTGIVSRGATSVLINLSLARSLFFVAVLQERADKRGAC